MTWYLILLVISACVLIGQTVLSFIGGEIDVDMDADLDSSDMLSFKGIVHFVFGFSLTLTTMGGVSVLSTFVAVLVGLLFTVGMAALVGVKIYMENKLSYFTFRWPILIIAGIMLSLLVVNVLVTHFVVGFCGEEKDSH